MSTEAKKPEDEKVSEALSDETLEKVSGGGAVDCYLKLEGVQGEASQPSVPPSSIACIVKP